MFYKKHRVSGYLVSCLIGTLLAVNAHAEHASPASNSASSPTPVAFNTLPVLHASTPIPGSTHIPADFNGDGTSDLLWFNATTSQLNYWMMAATVPPEVPPFGGGVSRLGISKTFNVTPGYFVGAVGDFNNDGFADLVFTSANHDLWLWTNNQHGGFTSAEIGTYPDNWQLIGAGDIDGDGYDDLLWMDAADCQLAYWTMHGVTRTGYRIVPVTCGYFPIAIGYFNSTNRITILWSSANNDLYAWDSTSNGFTSYNLSAYFGNNVIDFSHLIAIGGGYAGDNGAGALPFGIQFYKKSSDGTFDSVESDELFRSFHQGVQNTSGVILDGTANGVLPVLSAGFLIEGNGINRTGAYIYDANQTVLSTGGIQGYTSYLTGNTPTIVGNQITGDSWVYPTGWSVIGAPANTMTSPPWQ